jgi:hypothetical protein
MRTQEYVRRWMHAFNSTHAVCKQHGLDMGPWCHLVWAQWDLNRESLCAGNAPWPIGVTSVGIHERSAREKISHVMNAAHIMNDEATRKYLQVRHWGGAGLCTRDAVGHCGGAALGTQDSVGYVLGKDEGELGRGGERVGGERGRA